MEHARRIDPVAVVDEASRAFMNAADRSEIEKIELCLRVIGTHMRAAGSYGPAELQAVNDQRNTALVRLRIKPGNITTFDPKQAKSVIETLKAAVGYARRMQEWDSCMEAAELMVAWQREFVAWWTINVGVRKSAGNQHTGREVAGLRSLISLAQAEAETGITKQQVSRWRNALKRPDYAMTLFGLVYRKAMAGGAQRRADLQTGEMEWYTPSLYIEKARRVLGQIDIDPASCDLAQEIVQARRFFTVDHDGLSREWRGAVWLNPPYNGKLIAAFAAKLLDQINCGNVTSAIALTNAYTETSWFHNLARACNALCLTRGRIKFESPRGEKCAPTNGQCFFYFGPDVEPFLAEFGDIGIILVRHELAGSILSSACPGSLGAGVGTN